MNRLQLFCTVLILDMEKKKEESAQWKNCFI